MGKQLDVYTSLKASADALATALGLRAAFLDDDFDASIDPANTFEPFLQFKLFRNQPAWQGMTDGRLDQGLFQVDLVWPRGKDPVPAAYNAIDAIIATYPKGSYVGSLKVQRAAWAASPLSENDRTLTPITISWTI